MILLDEVIKEFLSGFQWIDSSEAHEKPESLNCDD